MSDEGTMPDEQTQDSIVDETVIPDTNLFAAAEAELEEQQAPDETEEQETPEAEPEEEQEQPDPSLMSEDKPSPKEEDEKHPPHIQRALDDVLRRERVLLEEKARLKHAAAAGQELAELQRLMKSDPLTAIQRLGGDLGHAIDQSLGNNDREEAMKRPEIRALRDEIDTLKRELTETRQGHQRAQFEQSRMTIYRGYEQIAKEQAETFPHVSMFAEQLGPTTMYQLADQHARQTGAWLDDKQVAEQADKLLQSQLEDILNRAAKHPMYKDRFVQNGDSRKATSAPTSKPPQGKTLRNKDTAEPPGAEKPIDLINADDEAVEAAGLAAMMRARQRKAKQ